VDFRLSINGLAVLVEQALGLDPFASCAYVFSNRRRDQVKILSWERNGFWLLLKRLEKDRLIWPSAEAVPTLTAEQLHWLLEGIDIAVVQRHSRLRFYVFFKSVFGIKRAGSNDSVPLQTAKAARNSLRPKMMKACVVAKPLARIASYNGLSALL
jgi:hypothetical protein